MKKPLTTFAIICICGLLPTACDMISLNPPLAPGENEAVPEILLGAWKIEKIDDQPPLGTGTVTISKTEAGSLQVSAQDDTLSGQRTVFLSRIGGNLVISMQSDSGYWGFYALEIDTAQQSVKIKEPDSAMLKRDIRDGVIAGEITGIDLDEEAIHLTASSTALRGYLESRTDLFRTVIAELKKSAP